MARLLVVTDPVLRCAMQDCIETSNGLEYGTTHNMSDNEIQVMYVAISPMMKLRANPSAKNTLVKQVGAMSENAAANLLKLM